MKRKSINKACDGRSRADEVRFRSERRSLRTLAPNEGQSRNRGSSQSHLTHSEIERSGVAESQLIGSHCRSFRVYE